MSSIERLKAAHHRVVGTRQTTKALQRGAVETVFVAVDAEPHVTRDIISKCQEDGIEVVQAYTMSELGKACRIDVGAATVAILKD